MRRATVRRPLSALTWTLDGGDLKELAEFEARLSLNQVYESHACIGLCQFDVRRFTPELLREMIMLHPFVVVEDRVCRNPYFVPPARYLARWRMHLASLWLRQDRLTVAETAARLGYDSEASFSRAFKRSVGRPPSALRRVTAG